MISIVHKSYVPTQKLSSSVNDGLSEFAVRESFARAIEPMHVAKNQVIRRKRLMKVGKAFFDLLFLLWKKVRKSELNSFKTQFVIFKVIFLVLSNGIIVSTAFSQQNKIIQYSQKPIHARAFDGEYIGTNNGDIYRLNFLNDEFQLVNKSDTFPEIRDIQSSFRNEIVVMQTGKNGAIIFIDSSGKTTRTPFYENNDSTKSIFLDGMSFAGNIGFLMGDPIKSHFSIYKTKDFGRTWTPCEGKIKAHSGEAAFAASGSTVEIINGDFSFVSGGLKSRYFISSDMGNSWKCYDIPFPSCESCGAYSMCYLPKKSSKIGKNSKSMIVVGGDYTKPDESKHTCFYSLNGGKTWKKPKKSPRGYRSCVIEANGVLYCCGTNGIDYSKDFGKTWNSLSKENCFALVANENSILATSTNGKILVFDKIND
jgi:photosystem II stability/assembly factor-like uncharacterized protein